MKEKFDTLPIMGILRGVKSEEIDLVTEVAVSAGITALEITMNTKNASSLIKQLVVASKNKFSVGAGTVLCTRDLLAALDAGASFVVMPTLVTEVADFCTKNNVPFFPGALTPQEIFNASSAGATMVKVFPANVFGPSYFRDLRGPFADIPLMACGGVTADNVIEYFKCGANAVSFGASIFKREWIENRDHKSIENAISLLIESYKQFAGG